MTTEPTTLQDVRDEVMDTIMEDERAAIMQALRDVGQETPPRRKRFRIFG